MSILYEVKDDWSDGGEFETLEDAMKHLQRVVENRIADGEDSSIEGLELRKIEILEFEIKVGVVLK